MGSYLHFFAVLIPQLFNFYSIIALKEKNFHSIIVGGIVIWDRTNCQSTNWIHEVHKCIQLWTGGK